MISAELEHAQLTVVLDVRHPFAYLALGPAIELGRALGVSINWLPLASETLRPPSEPDADDDRGIRHRRNRARMIAREIAVYAEAQDLVVREPYRSGPASAAHAGWLWTRAHARDSLEPFLVELFRRYWALELDAGDAADVANALEACGVDTGGFPEWAASEGPGAADRVTKDLEQAGAFATPAYLVGGEIFNGRQHLPMIRWILEGRAGRGPI